MKWVEIGEILKVVKEKYTDDGLEKLVQAPIAGVQLILRLNWGKVITNRYMTALRYE